jgi:hypothetical protein
VRQIVQDMNNVVDDAVDDKVLIDLIVALNAYSQSRGIESQGSQKHVDLLILISAILDIPEEGFNELLNRLNLIRLQQLGILSTSSAVKH